MQRKTTTCHKCTGYCPLVVTVEDNAVVAIEGDREAPLYNGFTCPKGRALGAEAAGLNRLTHSLKRMPDGQFMPISSAQLVEEIAQRVAETLDQYGSQAIAAFLGMPMGEQVAAGVVLPGFMGAIKSPLIFSNGTLDQPGVQIAPALHGTWDGGRSHPSVFDTLLLVGANPINSKQHFPINPAQQFKDMVKRGVQIVVIDPRRTEAARRAAVHLQIIPGEDPVVLAGLVHLILAAGGIDLAFLDENAQGVEALREAVSDFTPDYVAARAGIAVADLKAAAEVLMAGRRGDVAMGVGASMATRSIITTYLATCIQTLRGFWAKAGEPVSRPQVLLAPRDFHAQASPPQPGWGFGRQFSVRGLQETAAGMPTAVMPELMLSDGADRIRVCFLHNGAAYSWPQTGHSVAALRALDLLVVHDVELTATSSLADYVIATKTQLEVPQMTQSAEMAGLIHPGYGWTEPYAHYQPAVLEPPAGSDLLESWQVYYRVAQKLGLQLQIYSLGNSAAPTPLDMTREPTTDELIEAICVNSAVPLAAVKAMPHGGLFEERRDVVRPRQPGAVARLELGNAAMMAELAAIRAEEPLSRRKTDAAFPLLLICHRMRNSTNSTPRADGLIRTGYNPLFMHPQDMAVLALKSGDQVEIASRYGAIIGYVEPDPELRAGVVAMAHGFGARYGRDYDPRRDGANVNELLSWEDDYDPYHGMPRMSAVPVSVKVSEGARGNPLALPVMSL